MPQFGFGNLKFKSWKTLTIMGTMLNMAQILLLQNGVKGLSLLEKTYPESILVFDN